MSMHVHDAQQSHPSSGAHLAVDEALPPPWPTLDDIRPHRMPTCEEEVMAGWLDFFDEKDSGRTREHNVLVRENRAQDALLKEMRLALNAAADHVSDFGPERCFPKGHAWRALAQKTIDTSMINHEANNAPRSF
jgi:hypothetical protein